MASTKTSEGHKLRNGLLAYWDGNKQKERKQVSFFQEVLVLNFIDDFQIIGVV